MPHVGYWLWMVEHLPGEELAAKQLSGNFDLSVLPVKELTKGCSIEFIH